MPKPRETAGQMKGSRRTVVRDDLHWFNHPEMQARIAEAEADRCVGRVTRMDTSEEIEAYLNSLG